MTRTRAVFGVMLVGACRPLGTETQCGHQDWFELGISEFCTKESACLVEFGLREPEAERAGEQECVEAMWRHPHVLDPDAVVRSGGCVSTLNCSFTWYAVSLNDCELLLDLAVDEVACLD